MPDTTSLFSWPTLRMVWRLLQPYKRRLPKILFLIVIIRSLQILAPYLFKEIIDGLQASGISDPRIPWLIGATLMLGVAIAFIRLFRDHAVTSLLLLLDRDIPIRAVQKLMGLSLRYHEQHLTGGTMKRLSRGVDKFVQLIDNCLFEFVPIFIQATVTFFFLLLFEWRVAIVFAVIIPLFIGLTQRMNRAIRPHRLQRLQEDEQASGQLTQSLANVRTVQAFTQERHEVGAQRFIRQSIFEIEHRERDMIRRYNLARDFTIVLGRISVLSLAVYFTTSGKITIGSLVLYCTLAEQTYTALYGLTRLFDKTAEWTEAVARLTSIFDEQSTVTEAPDAKPAPALRGEIEFDQVSFAYDHGRETLMGVSFRIEPGTTTAIVGRSGCGKSTIINLLFRHYDPLKGRILIDGEDVRSFTFKSVRGQMAVVHQTVETFDGSFRDNIAFANPDASDTDILEAATLANADAFIMRSPHGFNTRIGERGVRLSGGERQRIGIARALLIHPKILIFDEATSNLDGQAEASIQDALKRIRAGRTTIVIAHRLHTIRHADRIIVLEHGVVVEDGTHDALMTRRGVYWTLYRRQSAPSAHS